MANVSVIKAVEESFQLIRDHYKEIAVPIIVMILLSGVGSLGGMSLPRSSGNQGTSPYYNADAMFANAMSTGSDLLAGLGLAAILGLVAIVLVIAFILGIINQAVQFYAFEHFYAILRQKKITENWQQRMQRLTIKSLFYTLFRLVLFGAVFGLPLLAIFFAAPSMLSLQPENILMLIALLVSLAILAVAVGIFFIPLWVYYALDRLPLSESIGKSISLVSGNLVVFLKFIGIFIVIGIATAIGLILTCCFMYLLSPVVQVFLTLLSGVTVMKLKLALEEGQKKR
jgi:hypothetical protein